MPQEPEVPENEQGSVKDKEVSTKQFIRFVRYNPRSFAGLHKDLNIAIVFDDPDKRMLAITGDQGTGKTSSLQALYSICGGMPPKNAVNETDKAIDNELVFERGGEQYVVRQTKGSFTVTRHKDGEKSKMDAPKEFLKKVIGPIGLNPMDLKNMKGKDQIDWIRDLIPFTPDRLEGEKKLLADKQKDYDLRTDKKKTVKQLIGEITSDGYYTYDEDKSKFAPTAKFTEDTELVSKSELNEEVVGDKFKIAGQKKDSYNAAVLELNTLAEKRAVSAVRVEELRQLLEEEINKGVAIQERIDKGNTWVEENKTAIKEYDALFKQMQALSDVRLKNSSLVSVGQKLEKVATVSAEVKDLDKKLDQHLADHKKFIQSFTPKIEGLEIVVSGTDDKRDEGIYYKEKTMIMLSESEIFELYIQLLAYLNIQVAIIENVTSLGSAAIERINWFAEKSGGYVFYSAMERGQEKLGFQFIDKIK